MTRLTTLKDQVVSIFEGKFDWQQVVTEERLKAALAAAGLLNPLVTRFTDNNVEVSFTLDSVQEYVLPVATTWRNLNLDLNGLVNVQLRLRLDLVVGWKARGS